MASIRARKDSGLLFFDFRFKGVRCREQTALPDAPDNRRKMDKVLKKIEAEIEAGTFEYRRYFPNSKLAAQFDAEKTIATASAPEALKSAIATPQPPKTPLFKDFANTWFGELSIGWRRTYQATVRNILDQHLVPEFGERAVSSIRREDILRFRSDLAKVRGRKEGTSLSARRINAIALVLRQILNEAADRYEFNTPALRIRPLKEKKSDIQPFSLEEVQLFLSSVRADFRNYYKLRFFGGFRTAEIDGLKWKYIDFDRRLIMVRETYVHGVIEDDAKTRTSLRDVQMSRVLYEALKEQEKATRQLSEFVFCNRDGKPLDTNNVTKRVWYPLLRHLGLKLRNPYQSRHTAATLWLASGENPEWIARQLGHANTQMLFTVYSRFVPNLTRQDGSAFERLLLQSGAVSSPALPAANEPASAAPDVETNKGVSHA